MKIGYVGMNTEVGCVSTKTFRLASFSTPRLIETVRNNLGCLLEILKFNAGMGLLYFRITSGLVPFASHEINRFDWAGYFLDELEAVGSYARDNKIRLTMHPDQFTLINSLEETIFAKSVRELEYQSKVLDLMGQGPEAKVQIHVGGAYGNKAESLMRFAERYKLLGDGLKKRLVVENDDRIFNVDDCLSLHRQTGIPVVFDNLHHLLNGGFLSEKAAMESCGRTWSKEDGLPSVDYSEQRPSGRPGAHSDLISRSSFEAFLNGSRGLDFDIMLETKGREKSAILALEIASVHGDPRLV